MAVRLVGPGSYTPSPLFGESLISSKGEVLKQVWIVCFMEIVRKAYPIFQQPSRFRQIVPIQSKGLAERPIGGAEIFGS